MAAITHVCLLILATVSATYAVSCYDCSYITTSDTPTNAVLKNLVTSMQDNSEASCADATDLSRDSCSMCSYSKGSVTITHSGGEKVKLESISRECHDQKSGSKYADYNKVGCYSMDSNNPYAKDFLDGVNSYSGISATIDGKNCLCNTIECNGTSGLGASLVGALVLAILALFA